MKMFDLYFLLMLRVAHTSKFESFDILSMCLVWRRIFISPAFTSMHNNNYTFIYKHTKWSWTRCTSQCGDQLGGENTLFMVLYRLHTGMNHANTRNSIYFRCMRFVYFYWLLLLLFYREFRIAFILTSNTVRSNLHTFREFLIGINRTRSK